MQLPPSVSALAGREGALGVELGRRRLLLPPPPPPPLRLGEEGGGRSRRGGGWVLLCNFSWWEPALGGCRPGRPDDAGVGDLPTRESPQGLQYVCTDPLLCPPPPQASPEGVSAVLPRKRPRRCGTVSVPSCRPSASMTHFAQLGSSQAPTTRAARPAGCHPRGFWRPTHRAGSRLVPSHRTGRGREGDWEKRN